MSTSGRIRRPRRRTSVACAYQKLDLATSKVRDGLWDRCVDSSCGEERTALLSDRNARSAIDGPDARANARARRASASGDAGTVRSSATSSGGVSFVPMMKTADLSDRHDAAVPGRGDRARDRRVLVQRQVRA